MFRGKVKEANEALRLAKERHSGSDHEEVAHALEFAGHASEGSGKAQTQDNPEALRLFEESLEMTRRLHTGDNADIANRLVYVGSAHGVLNNNEEALRYHTEALDMRMRLDTDGLQIAQSHRFIAGLLKAMGKMDQAVEHARLAVDRPLSVGPAERQSLVLALHMHGRLLSETGRAQEARGSFRRALDITKEEGAVNLKFLTTLLKDAAAASHEAGDLSDALEAQGAACHYCSVAEDEAQSEQEMIGIRKGHILAVDTMGDYLAEAGRLPKAVDAKLAAMTLAEPLADSGWGNSALVSIASSGADMSAKCGKHAALAKFCKAMLELLLKSKRAPVDVGISWMARLAAAHLDAGDYESSLQYERQVFKYLNSDSGRARDAATSLASQALCHHQMGNHDESVAAYQECLAIRERVLGSCHSAVAHVLLNLAKAEDCAGEAEAGLQHALRAVSISEELCDPNEPATLLKCVDRLNGAGTFCSDTGHHAEATKLQVKALKLHLSIHGPTEEGESASTEAMIHSNLSSDYANTGRPELALEHAQRCLVLRQKLFAGRTDAAAARMLATAHNRVGVALSEMDLRDGCVLSYEAALAEAKRLLPQEGEQKEGGAKPPAEGGQEQKEGGYTEGEDFYRAHLGNLGSALLRAKQKGRAAACFEELAEGMHGSEKGTEAELIIMRRRAEAEVDPQQAVEAGRSCLRRAEEMHAEGALGGGQVNTTKGVLANALVLCGGKEARSEGLALFDELAASAQAEHEGPHADVELAMYNAAQSHEKCGNKAEALQYYEKALQAAEGLGWATHPRTIFVAKQLAELATELGDTEGAESYAAKAASLGAAKEAESNGTEALQGS